MTPSVSVVIPPTLVRPTLLRAVMSVLGQTFRVEEIIVIAPPPDVPVPLPVDDRILVLRAEIGLGLLAEGNGGIEAAHGNVIALLDDDDEWYPTKLQRQLAAVGAGGRGSLDHFVVYGGHGSGYPTTNVAASAHRTRRVHRRLLVPIHGIHFRWRGPANVDTLLSGRACADGSVVCRRRRPPTRGTGLVDPCPTCDSACAGDSACGRAEHVRRQWSVRIAQFHRPYRRVHSVGA